MNDVVKLDDESIEKYTDLIVSSNSKKNLLKERLLRKWKVVIEKEEWPYPQRKKMYRYLLSDRPHASSASFQFRDDAVRIDLFVQCTSCRVASITFLKSIHIQMYQRTWFICMSAFFCLFQPAHFLSSHTTANDRMLRRNHSIFDWHYFQTIQSFSIPRSISFRTCFMLMQQQQKHSHTNIVVEFIAIRS